jgi:hypothetical protein
MIPYVCSDIIVFAQAIPLQRRYMMYMSPQTEEKFNKEYDKYGDSFTQDVPFGHAEK